MSTKKVLTVIASVAIMAGAAGTAAAQEFGACCYGDVYPPQCVFTDLTECELGYNGVWMGPGTDCSDFDQNGIADICEATERGACCYEDPDLGIQCVVTTLDLCETQYLGVWMGPGTNCFDGNGNGIADICEDQEFGACCYEDPDLGIQCVVVPQLDCEQIFAGTWMGPGTDCTDADGNGVADICEEFEKGACCYEDPDLGIQCVVVPQLDCRQIFAGTWMGVGTDCTDADGNGVADICEQFQEGACCYEDPDGTIQCVVVPQLDCEQIFAGTWMGVGTDCTDADGNGVADICEQFQEGACCYEDPDLGTILCVVVPQLDCEQIFAGTWMGVGTDCTDADGNGVADICEEPDEYRIEFSLDIGSDTELSDPFMNGNEAFDPGDVYWWRSAPVIPPGRDGFKDDEFIFGQDPWPQAPDASLATRVPVGLGDWQMYAEFYDTDGHDQLDLSLYESQLIPPDHHVIEPIWSWDSPCIHLPEYLLISHDDDKGAGWAAPYGDVPVTAPSPAGVSSYGSTAGRDEVFGLTLAPLALPAPFVDAYPFANEEEVHSSLAPNPDDPEERYDDDVDSLDIVVSYDACPYWYITADQEAYLGLDPGDIYEVTPWGAVPVVDDVIHLGLPDEVDIDAFEFVWLPEIPHDPGTPLVLAVIFSVDDDDPATPWDESGGLPPNVLFGSVLDGQFHMISEEWQDDIDAVTAWHTSLNPNPGCPGDMNCDGMRDYFDINYLIAALGGEANWIAYYQAQHGGASPPCDYLTNCDMDGNGSVDYFDISPFLAVMGQPCP